MKPVQARQGFRVTFRHPFLKSKLIAAGLGADYKIAQDTCIDLEALCKREDIFQAGISHPDCSAYSPRALAIFLRSDVKTVPNMEKVAATVADKVLSEFKAVGVTTASPRATEIIQNTTLEAVQSRLPLAKEWIEKRPDLEPDARERALERRKLRECQSELEKAQRQIANLTLQNQELHREIDQYKRKLNKHCKESFTNAIIKFNEFYKQGHGKGTIAEVKSTLESFKLTLESNFKLGDIKAEHLNNWLNGLKSEAGTDLAPQTRQRRKAYLSTFWTWAVRQYDLSENPIEKMHAVPGANRPNENIVAMRQEEITSTIKKLKSIYWKTWFSFAVLAGPRWSEQAYLKWDDIHLEDNYVIIRAPKTGRQRRVSIEQTTLKEIFTEYGKKKLHPVYVFSSLAGDNPYKQRRFTPDGVWSSHRNWWDYWIEARDKAKLTDKYGPAEWRHTFGTALGHCGYTSLEISQLMGNSSAVCEAHYVATINGNRWTFKWR